MTRRNVLRIWLLTLFYLVFGKSFLETLDPDEMEEVLRRLDKRLPSKVTAYDFNKVLKELYPAGIEEILCAKSPLMGWLPKEKGFR